MLDVVIRNGLYMDGTGDPARAVDVGVANGKVVKVAACIEEPASQTIDAEGCWVTPGFIEPHSHYDAEIIVAPELAESVRHGVTTVMTGICSISMICAEAEDCSDLFTRVEAVPREHVLPLLQQRKTWSNPAEFKQFFEQHPLGPNLAAFIGHSDIRAAVMGLEGSVGDKPATDAQLQQMEQLVDQALDNGFLGLSTMTTKLDRLDGDRAWAKPLPSTFGNWREYRRLNRILRRRGGILQSAPDAVGKINVLAFLWETIGWFRRQLKTTLLTVMDLKSQPYNHVVTRLAGWASRVLLGGDLRWQFLPSPMVVYAYGLDFNSFGELADARVLRDMKDPDEPYAEAQKPEFRHNLRKNMNSLLSAGLWHRDFSDAWVVECPEQRFIGRNFAEIGKELGKDPIDTLLDLAIEHREGLRWGVQFGNHRPSMMRKLLKSPSIHVGFADSGAHLKNLASYNFPICLLKYVQDGDQQGEASISMPQAVRRLTGELADWYGIDAGYIREGDRADIAIVDPKGLTDDVWEMVDARFEAFDMDRLVNRNDQAVKAVLINGKLAYSQEAGLNAELGKVQGYGQYLSAQHVQ